MYWDNKLFNVKTGKWQKAVRKLSNNHISVQFSLVTQSCPSLCDLMNHSMPGLPAHHQLQDSTQIHVHRVGDAVQPSHPLSSPFLPAPIPPSIKVFQMSQLFTSGGQSIGTSDSTSALPMNTQVWTLLGWADWISWKYKGLSRVFSNTTVKKKQFFGAQLSL